MIELIAVQNVDVIWPLISKDIVKCSEKTPSYLTAGDLWTMCRSGNAFLIIASDPDIKGFSIWRFGSSEYFECVFILGSAADGWFKSMLDFALELAVQNGRKGIGGESRVGLVKLMKRHFPRTKIVRQTYVVEI